MKMLKLIFILTITGLSQGAYENVVLLMKKRSAYLVKYKNYADIAISQVEVPPETAFLSLKISAEPYDLSIYGCSPEKVEVYCKRGSIPVLNPDNSKNPKWVRNITETKLYGLTISTDKEFSYINITSPEPGIYYCSSFFAYEDPDKAAVKQKGLSQRCTGFINILAYVSEVPQLRLLAENYNYHVKSDKFNNYFKFSVTPNVREIVLKIHNIEGLYDSDNVTLRLDSGNIPSKDKYLKTKTINLNDSGIEIPYWLNQDGSYFLEFDFDKELNESASLDFSLRTLGMDKTFVRKKLRAMSNELSPEYFKGAVLDYYEDKKSNQVYPYILYNLLKESGSESFLYTYNINHEEEKEFMVPIPLNLTSGDLTVLKFRLEDIIDVGGTLEYSIHFQPPSDEKRNFALPPEASDRIIIGCISQHVYEIPTLPRHCVRDGIKTPAPVVVNVTTDNSTVLIPFPESGTWFATLKLFCKPCQECPCYRKCSEKLQTCISKCSCDNLHTCSKCSKKCKAEVNKEAECEGCNCDDKCEESWGSCNSTIMFDVSSFPCFMGRCGANGRCQFMVADGYIFSACSCRNRYRGLDCTDDSQATPFWKVVLAQILLITSNVVMLPCVYIAWKRKYYPEAVMYSFVFIFSSFYHACDVSDFAIQFCITSHTSLQFGDFFSALLAIWGTMLAISDINSKYRVTLHVLAAIVLAYCTVIDKTGVWIFLLIAIPGSVIIGVSWYFKYRKSGKNFINKNYLRYYFPSGAAVMGVGILIYAFLQTSGNYMYLHSLWHCIVGFTVLIVLPRKNTFLTDNL